MKCPKCESKIQEVDTICNQCGNSLEGINFQLLRSKEVRAKRRLVFLILCSIALVIGGLTAKNYLDTQQEKRIAKELAAKAAEQLRVEEEARQMELKRIETEKNDYSWVPKGFTKFSVNYNLAYKSISYDAADCYSNCWGFVVVSKNYCSTIKVSANIERGNTILDTDSDYASGVPSGTRAIMRITSSADLPWNASVTEATCT